jgi:hypothetical protein
MDRYLSLLYAAVALLACGGPPPDYRSSSGVSYHWHGGSWDTTLIEEQETWFEGKISTRFDPTRTMQVLGSTRVWVYGDRIPCGASSPSGYCNGLDYDYDLEVVQRHCPFDAALTHEMTHVIREVLEGDPDYDHLETELWQIADGAPRPCP